MKQHFYLKPRHLLFATAFQMLLQPLLLSFSLTNQCWSNEAPEAFQGDVLYATDRLSIQKISQSDRSFLLEHFGNPDVAVPAGLGKIDSHRLGRFVNGMYYRDGNLIIHLKEKNQPIGTIQFGYLPHFREALNDIASEYHQYILGKNALDIGYSIEPSHWRQGYGSEAITGFVNYLRQHKTTLYEGITLGALTANISPDLKASIGLALKCGFSLHGEALSPYGRQLYVYDLSKENSKEEEGTVSTLT